MTPFLHCVVGLFAVWLATHTEVHMKIHPARGPAWCVWGSVSIGLIALGLYLIFKGACA